MALKNRGKIFEETMKTSWATSNLNIERLRLSDKVGSERICDEVIIGETILYCEHKSHHNLKFRFDMIKSHQYRSLHAVANKRRNTVPVICIEFTRTFTGFPTLVVIEVTDILDAIKQGIMSADVQTLIKLGGRMEYYNDGRYAVENIYNHYNNRRRGW